MDLEKNQYETGGGASSQQQLEREVDEQLEKLRELARRQEKLAQQAQQQRDADLRPALATGNAAPRSRRPEEEARRAAAAPDGSESAVLATRPAAGSARPTGPAGPTGAARSTGPIGPAKRIGQRRTAASRRHHQAHRAGHPGHAGQPERARQPRPATGPARPEASRRRRRPKPRRGGRSRAWKRRFARPTSSAARPPSRVCRRSPSAPTSLPNSKARSRPSSRTLCGGPSKKRVPPATIRAPAAAGCRAASAASRKTIWPTRNRRCTTSCEDLERQMQDTIRRMNEDQRKTATKMREALVGLQQDEVSTRLRVASEYIRQGGAPYIASSEDAVTRSLEEFRDNMRDIEKQAAVGTAAAPGPGARTPARAVGKSAPADGAGRRFRAKAGRPARARAAARRPTGPGPAGPAGPGTTRPGTTAGPASQAKASRAGQQGQGGQQGQQGQEGQQGQQGQGQGQGQQGAGQSGSGLAAGNQPRGGQPNGWGGGGGPQYGPNSAAPSASNFGNWGHPGGLRAWDAQTRQEMERALQEGARQIPNLTNQLRSGRHLQRGS